MTRLIASLAAVLLALAACTSSTPSGGGGAATPDPTIAFCAALDSYGATLVKLDALHADGDRRRVQGRRRRPPRRRSPPLVAVAGPFAGAQLNELQTAQSVLEAPRSTNSRPTRPRPRRRLRSRPAAQGGDPAGRRPRATRCATPGRRRRAPRSARRLARAAAREPGPAGDRRSPMPASPAPSPRTRSSPRSATSRGSSLGSFREVFEVVTRRRAPRPASCRSRTSSTARSARTTTCCSSTTSRSAARSSCPVRLCLAALPGQRLDDIERVYSHIQALGQAEAFLRAPAVAAADDLQHGRRRQGDRRSRRARRGGRPVAAGRGAVRAGDPRRRDRRPAGQPDALRRARPARATPPPALLAGPATGSRTTLVVAVRNEPGTLLEVLRVFAAHGLNMSKLESRPSRERAWEYVFWVDLDVAADDPAIRRRARRARGRDDDGQGPRARTCAPPTSGLIRPATASGRALAQLVADLGQQDLLGRRAGRRLLLDEHLADDVDDEHHDDEHDQRVDEQAPADRRPPRPSRSCRGRS